VSRVPTDPLGENYCELSQPWEAKTDRSPYEDLRALMRAVTGYPSISEISATAYRYIPGLGDTDTHIVKRIYAEFAEEHALARAEQWMDNRDDPPTLAIPDARTKPEDDGTVVASETVRATLEYRLGARSPRSCLDHDPDSVIDCAGPDEPGYCCPACSQQRRRDDAIIEALLTVWNDETDDANAGDTEGRTQAVTATDSPTNSAETKTTEPNDLNGAGGRNPEESGDDTQPGLHAFVGDERGGNA
jgi:hypothetical protein